MLASHFQPLEDGMIDDLFEPNDEWIENQLDEIWLQETANKDED